MLEESSPNQIQIDLNKKFIQPNEVRKTKVE
jgi:hypothetical protein